MGVVINSTEKAQIKIQHFDGSEQDQESVYARLEMAFRTDGSTIEIAFPYQFISKEAFKLNAPNLKTNIPSSCTGTADFQTMENAHELVKTYLEQLGFAVTIDL